MNSDVLIQCNQQVFTEHLSYSPVGEENIVLPMDLTQDGRNKHTHYYCYITFEK